MMRFLRSAFVIARRDFAATVLSKAFIFFLLAPLFPLLMGGVFGGIGARVAIIAAGKVAFDGEVDEARNRLRPIVRLRTRSTDGVWRSAIPDTARIENKEWVFELPSGGPEPLLKALIDGGAGIETLAIERPGLHDAFVAIAGDAAAAAMGEPAKSE